ncbi:TPA: histidinol-phosphate transaminase [Haemophilus influenzae]|uniref:Histidinol-phosphate aminotransferase n=4 Tax=Gammaproteobacteria TaxID=1236 RepID=HIS8_HAEIG|nr:MULTISPECIES: histidinol-phosphate transaminase [Haemophilus]A5UGY2.1 RecName: Full=Histidinol-phosphate aminotransferase; AltName: Full=Imidazole acetol-phosphate transaminase [Haemophilus influenzae PittGG]ABR00038.1 histidinol-phosphate aminotransferase [Haemophilus influenzae PittGG]AIT67164.1 histidinol-phosphate aminotransferase [Haemophilus influenzae]AJO88554.1 Histidinol-phosphate aminotransferase [Haemophilus influenzae]AJO91643.1 Histidinol-phosphate aminotransferase [Haemophilus
MTITTLSRQNIQALTPYQSARKLGGNGTIWLNANEYPTSPEFQLSGKDLNRYPEPQPQRVVQAYANYAGVSTENVLVTRGGDEGIELIIHTFCEPKQDAILFCPPTYGMYAVSAETAGVLSKTVPLTDDFQLNLPEIKNHLNDVKVVFVCSPNNPTGNLLKQSDILDLLQITAGKAIVVVDEAYIEFCPEASVINLLKNYPHLAIIRTLSKAFALAGLRCGFVLANPELIDILSKVIAPYPIPVPSADLAEQALRPANIATVQALTQELLSNRQWLAKALLVLHQVEKVYESEANYLLIKCQNGQAVFKALWEQGIILRDQNKTLHLQNCIRITVGTRNECEKVVEAIKEVK